MVTNLYPPTYLGGYEVRCAQAASALRRLGHDVFVVTSAYGLPLTVFGNIRPRSETVQGVPVSRWLNQDVFQPRPNQRPWTLFQARRELRDARRFLELVRRVKPDVINWWSMYGLSKLLLPLPRLRGIPDVHWIEHWWMIEQYGVAGEKVVDFWNGVWDGGWGPRVSRPLLRWMGRVWEGRAAREGLPTRSFPNRPAHVCFVSKYMETLHREAGLEFPSSEVIHGGVPVAEFYLPLGQKKPAETLRILYAGQISPDRGLHTAVEALGHLPPELRSRVTFSVAGESASDYFAQVKARVLELGLGNHVSFLGKVSHEGMREVYGGHDLLVFPSTRREGLPLTMVEAMLAGCAVVTTGSGGAMEIATAADLPVFPKHDSLELSRILMGLLADPSEVLRIASRGQEVALREFSFDTMMEKFVATLVDLSTRRSSYP